MTKEEYFSSLGSDSLREERRRDYLAAIATGLTDEEALATLPALSPDAATPPPTELPLTPPDDAPIPPVDYPAPAAVSEPPVQRKSAPAPSVSPSAPTQTAATDAPYDPFAMAPPAKLKAAPPPAMEQGEEYRVYSVGVTVLLSFLLIPVLVVALAAGLAVVAAGLVLVVIGVTPLLQGVLTLFFAMAGGGLLVVAVGLFLFVAGLALCSFLGRRYQGHRISRRGEVI